MSLTEIGVFTLDTGLIVQVWDAALARATGIPAETAIGQSILALFPELEERGQTKYFLRVIEDGIVEVLAPAFHHYLIPCPPSTPSERFDKMQQRATIAPLRQGDSIVGVIVTLEDVTARLDRERDLAERLRDTEEITRLEAARAFVDSAEVESTQPLVGALHDSSWRVRRVAVEGLSSRAAPDAIAALLELVRTNHANLSLLNSALQVLALTNVDTLSPLIEFLEGEDTDLRMQAALALGEQRDERAIPALITALKDPDINVRYHVIEALGKLKAVEAAELLSEIAARRDFFLSFAALEALEQIGDPGITSGLVPLLDDESLREAVASLLGKLGDEQTVAPLASLLNDEQTPPNVIARALATLYDRYEERYGEGKHIADLARQNIKATGARRLVSALNDHGSEDVRSQALVLGWLDGPEVDRTLTHLLGESEARNDVVEALVRHGERVIALLIQQLNAGEPETRRAAVIALGRIGDRRATPALLKCLESDDESLILPTIDSLAKIGDPACFESLMKLVGHEDAAVRQAVVGALNSLGVPEMPSRLMPLLASADPFVRESATRIAGYFGYSECLPRIIDLCSDDDERVRQASIEHLPYFDDERVINKLLHALAHDTPRVRAAAANALAQIEPSKAVAPLLQALQDEDSWVRYFAARSLGQHQVVESSAALSHLARSDNFNHVRIAALEALGKIGGDDSVQVATSLSESGDTDLARAALAALGQMPQPAALLPLITASRATDPSLRAAAVTALGERQEAEVTEHLRRSARDEDPFVFQRAIAMLGKLGTPEAIADLIALIPDPVRRNATITTLAQLGEKVIDKLAAALSHQNSEIRRGIVEALARMKREEASALLMTAVDDPDPAVSVTAASALGLKRAPSARSLG